LFECLRKLEAGSEMVLLSLLVELRITPTYTNFEILQKSCDIKLSFDGLT